VLRRIPHPDPLIVLPEPIYVTTSDPDQLEEYSGFIVTGVKGKRRRTSSADPDASMICLHFLGTVVDAKTLVPVEMRVAALSSEGERVVRQIVGLRALTSLMRDETMSERAADAVRDMLTAGPTATIGFPDKVTAEQAMTKLTEIGLAILVYLVTDGVDAKRSEPVKMKNTKNSRNAKKNDTSEPTMYELGFRVGAALRASKEPRNMLKDEDTVTGQRRPTRAHVRRAHVHTFRVGVGRKDTILRWLPPIPVAWDETRAKEPQIHVL
jgi:hypothetical protein